MANVAQYRSSYTSFSGADIVAVVHNKVVGELQGISYSVTREKVPIYTMGSPDPRSFSRGKRGIAGSMVFTVFNKDVFDDFKDAVDGNGESLTKIWTAAGNKQSKIDGTISDNEYGITLLSTDDWEQAVSTAAGLFKSIEHTYADEIFPFDVTITMRNEYGQGAKFSILGCEILNEGMGVSIDDITTEKACTFVARGISKLTALGEFTQVVGNTTRTNNAGNSSVAG
jgi:hypothetical protein